MLLKAAALKAVALSAIAATALAAVLPERTVIVTQPGSPIQITKYQAHYNEGNRFVARGIAHMVSYTNTSPKKVVAFRVGIVSFNVFDEFLGRMGGYATEDLVPNKGAPGTWTQNVYAGSSFHTGIMYVDKVRFEDGTMWVSDKAPVLEAIRQLQKDFDSKLLEERLNREVPGGEAAGGAAAAGD
ncbi:MAG TPA: hypothetical protein VFS40_12650 [Gemmatimonadales bacterium]|nr:hypothetical protein [Gemmatimonadales bacterium]